MSGYSAREATFDAFIRRVRRGWFSNVSQMTAIITVILICFHYVGLLNVPRLRDGIPSIFSLIMESIPPDFSDGANWVRPVLDTLAMSIAGTALAIFFSLPVSIAAARNTSPHPVLYHVSRWVLNAMRSIPELIMGIIFVAAVGFGPLPGVLALGLHSVGMVGKFFAEAIEHANIEPI
jgi:phosphonate transport system permease protein